MKRDECPGSLLTRARRRPLSSRDRAALEAHLATCESCQTLLRIADDFDRLAISEPGDGARIERLASLARQWTFTQHRPGRVVGFPDPKQKQARVLLFAAAVFLLVAGASASIAVQRAVRAQEQLSQNTLLQSPVGPAVVEQTTRIVENARQAALDLHQAELETSEDAAPEPERQCASGGCGAARTSAAVLFRMANEARRAGEPQKAGTLYQKLQRQFPGSPQAQLSHVSLGHLLLGSGRVQQALEQFNRALRSAGASRVQAEAVYGKGLALGRLGRAAEERVIWRRLLANFSESPYAAHARRRLGGDE